MNRPFHYVLEGRVPVAVDESDLLIWADWMKTFQNRVVRQDRTEGFLISTMFLGMDHNWSGQGAPVLFETMVFHNVFRPDYQTRCATWDEALVMHETARHYVNECLVVLGKSENTQTTENEQTNKNQSA